MSVGEGSSKQSQNQKITHIRANTVIASVYHFLMEEYLFLKTNNNEFCDLSALENIRQRTADATGVSELTVEEVLNEERRMYEKRLDNSRALTLGVWPLPTPSKKRKKMLEPGEINTIDDDDDEDDDDD